MMSFSAHPRSRWRYAALVLLVVGGGLLWRSRMLPLPKFYFKYGGDSLWALLVFLGFGFLFIRAATRRVAWLALGFCLVVELTQLYHAPWIDSVRETRLGHLVLGATFNWPDLIAYAVGVSFGCVAELTLRRVAISRPRPDVRVP